MSGRENCKKLLTEGRNIDDRGASPHFSHHRKRSSTAGMGDVERNQALLFRLSTQLKHVERLKSAQATVRHRMEVARRITPAGRTGSENKYTTTPSAIKETALRPSSIRLRSPLQARSVNVTPPASAAVPMPISGSSPEVILAKREEEFHPLSSLRKRRLLGKSFSLPPSLQIPDSPIRPEVTFKDALNTPVKHKDTDFISPGREHEEDETLKPLSATSANPLPSAPEAPTITEDVGIVLSIGAEGSSKVAALAPSQPASLMVRNLQRALRREVRAKADAIKAVEVMHAKIAKMHSHVEVAFKMKKIAEDKLAAAIEEQNLSQLESLRKVQDLQQTIQSMEKGHQIQKAQADRKADRLKKKLAEFETDMSGLETHLHNYERQINTLQAQIELLRRNMAKSAKLHKHAELSPTRMRINSSATATP